MVVAAFYRVLEGLVVAFVLATPVWIPCAILLGFAGASFPDATRSEDRRRVLKAWWSLLIGGACIFVALAARACGIEHSASPDSSMLKSWILLASTVAHAVVAVGVVWNARGVRRAATFLSLGTYAFTFIAAVAAGIALMPESRGF